MREISNACSSAVFGTEFLQDIYHSRCYIVNLWCSLTAGLYMSFISHCITHQEKRCVIDICHFVATHNLNMFYVWQESEELHKTHEHRYSFPPTSWQLRWKLGNSNWWNELGWRNGGEWHQKPPEIVSWGQDRSHSRFGVDVGVIHRTW